MAIDLHVGEFGAEGPDTAPVGRIGDQAIAAVQMLAQRLGLSAAFAPTSDFVLSPLEVAAAVVELEDAIHEFESNGSSARSVGVLDLCNALREAAAASMGLSGFGD